MSKKIDLKQYDFLDDKIKDLEEKLGYNNDKSTLKKELEKDGMLDLFGWESKSNEDTSKDTQNVFKFDIQNIRQYFNSVRKSIDFNQEEEITKLCK